ncbi:MAG: Ig-like domain-containing protein, partial [Alistipes sp.]|nr:Ig-like domain-containing protein [Alistipes sp.]
MEVIKKFWKYILGAVVVLSATGIFLANVTADPGDPVITIVNAEDSIYTEGETFNLSAAVTLPNQLGGTMTVEELMKTNLVWTSDNWQVFPIKADGTDATTTDYAQSAVGPSISVKANKAGSTQITATFYYQTDSSGNITGAKYTPGASGFNEFSVKSNPYISAFVWKPLPNGTEYDKDKVYDYFGDAVKSGFGFKGNTYEQDKLTVWSRNDVVTYELTSIDQGNIIVQKGGISDVYIGPESAFDEGSNTFDLNLSSHITVMGAVRFTDTKPDSDHDHKFFTLTVGRYGAYSFASTSDISTISSNINNKDNGVTYTSTNENVAVMDNNVLEPKGAGYARIRAGIWDDAKKDFLIFQDTASALRDVDSSDFVDVKIPFVWLNDPVATTQLNKSLSVNDKLQLVTNAPPGAEVSFTVSDENVIGLTANGGIAEVTARSNGTATITAMIRVPDETGTSDKFTEYTETITATINVADSFSVVTDTQSISVGETTRVTAVGAPDGARVTFTIDGREITAVPGLTGKISSANPNVLEVTGVEEGTYEIVATTNYGGIEKRAVCTIYVKTSVTEITISPTSLIMGVNETATLRVTIDPNNAFNKNVTWVSSDPSVVEVNLDTKTEYEVQVTSKKGGVAMITAVSVSDGTKYATCTIN